MKKKNKIHFIFIALSILFLTTSIYLNINTTSYAKERIITEINNKPIVVEPAIEEIEENYIIYGSIPKYEIKE